MGQEQESVTRTQAPKDAHILIPVTCELLPYMAKGDLQMHYVKEPEVTRLSWIMWVGPL